MLHVESIEKSFDGFMAVNGATLKVERGDVVAVIGPNGAGKTTLFNLITGQLPPTAGRILVQGREYRRPGAPSCLPQRDQPVLSGGQYLQPLDPV
jgi:ABC-type branched-subunit amino acid transport system ATPase component